MYLDRYLMALDLLHHMCLIFFQDLEIVRDYKLIIKLDVSLANNLLCFPSPIQDVAGVINLSVWNVTAGEFFTANTFLHARRCFSVFPTGTMHHVLFHQTISFMIFYLVWEFC